MFFMDERGDSLDDVIEILYLLVFSNLEQIKLVIVFFVNKLEVVLIGVSVEEVKKFYDELGEVKNKFFDFIQVRRNYVKKLFIFY